MGGNTPAKEKLLLPFEFRPWLVDIAHDNPNTHHYTTVDAPNSLEKLVGTSECYGLIEMAWRQYTIDGVNVTGNFNLCYIEQFMSVLTLVMSCVFIPFYVLLLPLMVMIVGTCYYLQYLSPLTGIDGFKTSFLRASLVKVTLGSMLDGQMERLCSLVVILPITL